MWWQLFHSTSTTAHCIWKCFKCDDVDVNVDASADAAAADDYFLLSPAIKNKLKINEIFLNIK